MLGWLFKGKGAKAPEEQKDALGRPRVWAGTKGVVVTHTGGQGHYVFDAAILARGDHATLQFLLDEDDLVEDIVYNGSDSPIGVYHRMYGMCQTNFTMSEVAVNQMRSQLAHRSGKLINADNPIFAGTLPDGFRINVSVPPVTPRYPSFTIRRFSDRPITLSQLVEQNVLSAEAGGFLACAVDGLGGPAANALVVGGTGAGKTTLLSALTHVAPLSDRVVVIEDTRELHPIQPNTVCMATSEATDMNDLLKSALRMRPDRIFVGEVRGPEAKSLFAAMNTGHDGCLGTLHANNAREALVRVSEDPMGVPPGQMAALDLLLVVEARVGPGGTVRRVVEVAELAGAGAKLPRLNVLYRYNARKDALESTGVPSRLRNTICRRLGLDPREWTREVGKRGQALLSVGKSGPDLASQNLMLETRRERWDVRRAKSHGRS